MVNERESMIFGSIFYNKSGNIDDFPKNLPHAENLCMGEVFINDRIYFFVVTLFEADQAP